MCEGEESEGEDEGNEGESEGTKGTKGTRRNILPISSVAKVFFLPLDFT